jgi:replication-associated recombination protein RarA
MPSQRWYRPTGHGLEAKIGEKLETLRKRDAKARSRDESKS